MEQIGKDGTLEVNDLDPTTEMSLEVKMAEITAMTDKIMGVKTIAVLAVAMAEMDMQFPERIRTMLVTMPGITLDETGRTLFFCLGSVQMMAMDNSPVDYPTKQ